jgi:hypothetical protein
MLKLPFTLPAGWLRAFGYPGSRRLVGLYWEPSGDKACYDDGISSACGLCDNWMYLNFIHRPALARWLDENGVHLGNSDEPSRHWLVADAGTGDLYAAPRREAYSVLLSQRLPEGQAAGHDLGGAS